MIGSISNHNCLCIAYSITTVTLYIIGIAATSASCCLYIRRLIREGMSQWFIIFFFVCFICTYNITIGAFQIILSLFCASCRSSDLIRKFSEVMSFIRLACIVCYRIICKSTINEICCIAFYNRFFCTVSNMIRICRELFCF